MPSKELIVAVGLLSERDLRILGEGFKRAYPIDQVKGFEDLLRAIDDAERRAARDGTDGPAPSSPVRRKGSQEH